MAMLHRPDLPYVGQSIRRVEDRRLLQGRGQFVGGYHPPGTLAIAFVRSPHASARLLAVDPSGALQVPGVVMVLTGQELAAAVVLQRATSLVPSFRATDFPPLAVECVRFVGEAVAAVVACDRYVAEDATELVRVEYAPLPAVTDPERAMQPESPRVHAALPDNVLVSREFRHGDFEAACARADLVLEETFRIHRQGGLPLEPRGCC